MPGQNGRHFVGDVFECISFNGKICIWFKYHWIVFLMVQLTIHQCCFRWWHGVEQAKRHYQNQLWHSFLTQTCVTQPQWVKLVSLSTSFWSSDSITMSRNRGEYCGGLCIFFYSWCWRNTSECFTVVLSVITYHIKKHHGRVWGETQYYKTHWPISWLQAQM